MSNTFKIKTSNNMEMLSVFFENYMEKTMSGCNDCAGGCAGCSGCGGTCSGSCDGSCTGNFGW